MKAEDKKTLRKQFLEKRNALGERQTRLWSSSAKKLLYSVPEFAGAKACLVYVSKGNEVYTHDIIEENIKKKRVCVPAVKKENIVASLINYFDELKVGMFGILEPKRIVEFPALEIKAVVVPGVAFDEKGNRLGYGKGFFDRFLKKTDGKCVKIALCYEMQLAERVPFDKNDVKMDYIVTERRVIKPGR